MLFEWMSDPAAWAGLGTLVILEIILGIDNLVFIAILADKLPPHQREKARIIGLSLALIMRLGLLASIAWIVSLTQPLFSVVGLDFSGRDLILIFGGLFLLFKGTMELHERLEGHIGRKAGTTGHAIFWQVLAQIVVLDAVFSLDSVITAVGMVDDLAVMMIAVVLAMIVMMVSSKPLMAFVSRHPTVVILCLGFLMMIGFSLIIEGFGVYVPKAYLYAAIGFSVLIEVFNQIGRRNKEKALASGDLRDRTANAVLRLLGGRKGETNLNEAGEVIAAHAAQEDVFANEERAMIEGVLSLARRPVASIMTPRKEVDWLNLDESDEALRAKILDLGHSRFLLARGDLDHFLGAGLAKDLLRDLMETGSINLERSLRQPLVVHESLNVLRVTEQLRGTPLQMVVVVDEYGALQGIATPTDVLEAIAGDFPEDDEELSTMETLSEDSWLIDGHADIHKVSATLSVDLADPANRYSTLAGYVLFKLGRLPEAGHSFADEGLQFDVMSMDGRSIERVRVTRLTPD